jgi:glycosyltransferase involved in cell wall biosynthesis
MSAPKRLAFFMPSLGCGGVERVLLRLASAFADRGFAVDIVVARAEGFFNDGSFVALVPKSVNVIDLRKSRILLCLPALTEYLRRARPDALLSAMDHANIVALWAKVLAKSETRVVVSVHSTASRESDGSALKRLVMRKLLPFVLPRAAGVVAVSKGAAGDYERYMNLAPGSVKVIYNPVIGSDVPGLAAQEPPHPWFANKTTPLVLGVGRLTPAKDYPLLIKAMASVHARAGARLVILGDGPERPKLAELIKKAGLEKAIDMPGFSDNPFSYMKRADVLALSSEWEGLPTVLIEAMATGTPVVSTDCPSGPAEILENGKWGRLVPPGDADALANALVETLKDPRRDQSLSRAADFSVETIIRDYAEVLAAPLGARGGA